MKKLKYMKILIPNATSPKNIGDQAMLHVLIDLVRSVHKNVFITVHSTDPHLYKKTVADKIDNTLYSWAVFSKRNKLIRLIRISKLFLQYVLLKFQLDRIKIDNTLTNLIEDYRTADLIVFVGNGYVRSTKGITQSLNLFMLLMLFEFAKIADAKKIVSPLSFGPFAYAWQERLAKKCINNLDVVSAREKFSFELMKKNDIKNLILSTDHSLLVKKRMKKNKNYSTYNILGFTIRKWFNKEKQESFEKMFAEGIVKFAKDKKIFVQPIVQVNAPEYGDIDMHITQKIVRKLREEKVKVKPIKVIGSLDQGLKIYSDIDFLVGMRMHSNILAATQGVPFVGISYEYKTEGIMNSLGIQEFCIRGKHLTGNKLRTLLNNLYKNKSVIKKKIADSMKSILYVEEKKWRQILNGV